MGYCNSRSYLWRIRTYLIEFHSKPLLPFNMWNLLAELGTLRVRGSRAGFEVRLRGHKSILSRSTRFIFWNNLQTSYGFRSGLSTISVVSSLLMIYVRSDIHFLKVKHLKGITPEEWAAFRPERLILKVKLSRSWISVVSVYRPPSILKHQWTRELSSIFSKRSLHLQRLFSTLETSTPICWIQTSLPNTVEIF